MELMTICYPELDKSDFDWIQSIRKKHDPQYTIVAPHFSLVFPISGIAHQMFIDHCKNICDNLAPFSFVIRDAVIHNAYKDDSRYVFMVPDEGKDQIIDLHDNLYTDLIEHELVTEIPFIPHMTIARSYDSAKCKVLTDNINAQNIEIRGRITSVDIILIDGNNVRTLEKIPLEEYPK